MRDLNWRANNTEAGRVVKNYVNETLNPERWVSGAVDYAAQRAKINYSSISADMRTVYTAGLKTYEQSAGLFLKYGHIEEIKLYGQKMEHYFVELDKQYLDSNATKALRFLGRPLKAAEWASATTKVQSAWKTQGVGEASWVAAREYGELTLSALGTGVAVAMLPEEAAGMSIIGALANISARVGGGAIGETSWKTWVERKHHFHDEIKETDRKLSR